RRETHLAGGCGHWPPIPGQGAGTSAGSGRAGGEAHQHPQYPGICRPDPCGSGSARAGISLPACTGARGGLWFAVESRSAAVTPDSRRDAGTSVSRPTLFTGTGSEARPALLRGRRRRARAQVLHPGRRRGVVVLCQSGG
ncbi:MAG: hypothetical protein ACFFA6_17685, partial [Promethearchaeota archaeon]